REHRAAPLGILELRREGSIHHRLDAVPLRRPGKVAEVLAHRHHLGRERCPGERRPTLPNPAAHRACSIDLPMEALDRLRRKAAERAHRLPHTPWIPGDVLLPDAQVRLAEIPHAQRLTVRRHELGLRGLYPLPHTVVPADELHHRGDGGGGAPRHVHEACLRKQLEDERPRPPAGEELHRPERCLARNSAQKAARTAATARCRRSGSGTVISRFGAQKLWNSSWYIASSRRFSITLCTCPCCRSASLSHVLPERTGPMMRRGEVMLLVVGMTKARRVGERRREHMVL